jgi:alanine dehydrogenase
MQTTENNQQQQALGAVAHTSTLALTNASLPFILENANKGYVTAMQENLINLKC